MTNLVMTARALLRTFDKIAFDKEFDIKNTIMIAGAPRSGTTWLMEILCDIPGYTSLFEPLNPYCFPPVKEAGFKLRTYNPSGYKNEKMYKYMFEILTGKITSLYPWYRFNISNLLNRIHSKKLLVKFVRANRLLPWISEKFDLRLILYIMRHPYAVISSQINTGFTGYNGEDGIDVIPDKNILLKELKTLNINNQNIIHKIENIRTKEEHLAFAWCLDHYVPYKYNTNKWITLKYEDMLNSSSDIVNDLLKKIGEENHFNNVVRKISVKSFTTIKRREELSQVQKDRISEVFSLFSFYVDEDDYGFE